MNPKIKIDLAMVKIDIVEIDFDSLRNQVAPSWVLEQLSPCGMNGKWKEWKWFVMEWTTDQLKKCQMGWNT